MRRSILSLIERCELAWEGASLAAAESWRRSEPVRARISALATRMAERPLTWSVVLVSLFCAFSILVIDRPLALFLKAHVSGDVEGFFRIVTRLGEAQLYMVPAGILWVVLMVGSLRAAARATRDRLRRLSFLPGFMFLTMAISGIISNILKYSLGRYRPRYLFDQDLYGFSFFHSQWAMNSFPSGHSQAAFAAMTALIIIVPRYDLLWLLIAVLAAMSRVMITVHFLSDAVAGSFLSILVTVLLARAFRARGIELRLGRPYDHRLN